MFFFFFGSPSNGTGGPTFLSLSTGISSNDGISRLQGAETGKVGEHNIGLSVNDGSWRLHGDETGEVGEHNVGDRKGVLTPQHSLLRHVAIYTYIGLHRPYIGLHRFTSDIRARAKP